ncbi:hypothetical protein GW17_00009360 [Ensete ventricosum]|nr:hypothetical protein GW17_00009360 [Ensete ventricosum]
MAMLGLPAARSSSTPTAAGEPMAVAPSPARTRPRLTVAAPTSPGRQRRALWPVDSPAAASSKSYIKIIF